MADLSSLLNPAAAEPDQDSQRTSQKRVKVDTQHEQILDHEVSSTNAQSPTSRNAIMSPGLDALATAASNFAPLVSPTQQTPSTISPIAHHSKAHQEHTENQRVDQNAANPTSYSPHLKPGDERKVISDNVFITQPSQPFLHPLSTNAPPPVFTESTSSQPDTPRSMLDQVQVKSEAIDSPIERGASTVLHSLHTDLPPSHLSQRVASPGTPLKNVTNTSPGPPASEDSILPSKRKGPPSKKRAAPKKGTAVKPPPKRRKIDGESISGSPTGARTGTPANSRASNTPGPKNRKGNSATPTRGSSVLNGEENEEEEEEESGDDNELYCVCRKPDDHSVMIACDGPCQDWFHTRCVDMNTEKVDLISKWYCPNCAAEGHETLWKRKCRLEDCSKPAQIDGKIKSKYCCHDHGLEFMSRRLHGHSVEAKGGGAGKKKMRSENDTNGRSTDSVKREDEDYEHPRGGIVRPEELKALIDQIKDVNEFRKLGDSILSPPDTLSPSDGDLGKPRNTTYSPEEMVALESISQQSKTLKDRRSMLLDRDKFISMVVTRAKGILAELKEKDKSIKDICGYDARLTWTEYEFNAWRTSEEGQHALETETLQPPPNLTMSGNSEQNGESKPNAEASSEGNKLAEETEIGLGVCKKRRCERHRAWLKGQYHDNSMEKDEIRQGLAKLELEEKVVKDHAMIRSLESKTE